MNTPPPKHPPPPCSTSHFEQRHHPLLCEGGVEPVLRGVVGSAAPLVNPNMLLVEEVTERLLVPNVPQHLDLASLNLQRGRDHGLPGT